MGFVAFALALSAVLGAVPAVADAASPPSIDSVSVSGITNSDATLETKINPNGLDTTYELYLSSPVCQADWPMIGPCMAIQVFSVPGGSIPAGSGDQTVSLDLNSAGVSLSPGEHYEYWVTATNAAGTITGPARDFTAPEDGVRPVNTAVTPSGGGSGSGSGSRASDSSASRPTTSAGTSSKRSSVDPGSSKRHVKRRHSQSRTLVAYTAEGGLSFRHTSLIVLTRGQSTVTFNRCVARFRLNAALWKRLETALKQTNLHAIAGDYSPPPGAADEITEVITVGHDTVRITDFASIPKKVRQELEPLVVSLREIVTVGERRMPPSCSSKRTSKSMG